MTISDLKSKEVNNLCDGKKSGHPIDPELNDQACAAALIIPGRNNRKSRLKGTREGIVIP